MELHILLSKEEKERQKGKGGSFKYTWQPPGLELEKVNSINKVIVLYLLWEKLPASCLSFLLTSW